MNVKPFFISDVLLFEPDLFLDQRGFFFESFNQKEFEQVIGREIAFVQDNHSRSVKGVLRGLHFQDAHPQGKLVRVTQGEVFDVAVDIRPNSPHYGKWVASYLSAENKKQHWIPEGFAHGYQVISDTAEVLYKVTDYYAPEFERCIAWDDPTLAIHWPLDDPPKLSGKDQQGLAFAALK